MFSSQNRFGLNGTNLTELKKRAQNPRRLGFESRLERLSQYRSKVRTEELNFQAVSPCGWLVSASIAYGDINQLIRNKARENQ